MQLLDSTFSFGCWRYSPGSGTLWYCPSQSEPGQDGTVTASAAQMADSDATPIVLEPRLHALLNHFVSQPDAVHAKTDLLDALWGNAEGTDAALMRAVGMLRKVLMDTTKPATYIETLPKRGYRWVAPIRLSTLPAPEKVPQKINASMLQESPEVKVDKPPVAAFVAPVSQRKHEQQRRLKLLSVFFLCAVLALVTSLLLFFSKSSYIPTFTRQVTISAMAGQEQKPILSPDQKTLYYQQQTNRGQWRWIAHQLSNHQKKLSEQQFVAIGAGQWFHHDLVFPALSAKGCSIYRLQVQQIELPATAWLPCQQFVAQGLASEAQEFVWLDQNVATGATQLWRFNGQKAELLQSFADAYRRPVAAVLAQQQVHILLQQDDFNTSLFRYELATASLFKVADFPYAFVSMSDWDDSKLLLSGTAGSFLFAKDGSQLIGLQLAAGAYSDQRRVSERLLATEVPRDLADLLPLQPTESGRSSTLLSASPWLSSNRTDQLLSWNADQAALVSERSGLPQIWWFDGKKVIQLTRFPQWRQITQLIWAGQDLYAVIDQQLQQVSLSDGSLIPALLRDRQLRHIAYCHDHWYWAELTHQQWSLKTLNEQQLPIEVMAKTVDLRCAAQGSLLLQQQDGSLVRYWPTEGRRQSMPWTLNWRQLSGNSWVTTSKGVYWLDGTAKLWYSGWQQLVREQIELPERLQVTGLYGEATQDQLFLQISREPETDVVWLQPQQFQ